MEKWSKQLERLFSFLKTKNGQIFIYACFVLAFFIPRFLAHLRYGTMEDELLSMHFNLSFATKDLFVAPDHAHPPLWYVLMDWPTQILGISHGIFYYRLIQVVVLFVLL